jgi:hypothetical protein
MPIGALVAQQAFLDDIYGSTSGAHSPANWELALFTGDILTSETAVEADSTTCPGYARVTFAQSLWLPTGSDGVKRVSAAVAFPDATDEWVSLTHWGLYDAADHVTLWNVEPLAVPLDVTAASTGPTISPAIFMADAFLTP